MTRREVCDKVAEEAALQLCKIYLEQSKHWLPSDKIAFWRHIESYAKFTREDIENYGGR